jgi:hypothetical protein
MKVLGIGLSIVTPDYKKGYKKYTIKRTHAFYERRGSI